MIAVENSSSSYKPYFTQLLQRVRPALIGIAALMIGAVCSGTYVQHAHAIFQFTEVGAAAGIEPYTMASGNGAGVATADFDDDGDIDIFVPNRLDVPDQLYVNLGNGTFVESANDFGLASLNNNRSALWFDYDGDHVLDLIVAGDCARIISSPCAGRLTLYRQTSEDGFVDVTASAGDLAPTGDGHLGGISAGDINNDGYLDLYVAGWQTESALFLNDGDGTFTDISVSSGVGISDEQVWQAMFHDFDDDGWTDIYLAVDFSEPRLWMNQGDNTFVDVAPQANLINEVQANEMGVTISDYDNDLDFDFYVTNTPGGSALYDRDPAEGSPTFSDVAIGAGAGESSWAWGCAFLDANNDGLVDLALTNGYTGLHKDDVSAFFLNNGGNPVTFSTVSSEVGFDDTLWGSSLVSFDYDRDGHLDLLQSTNSVVLPEQDSTIRLLRNTPDPEESVKQYIVIKPRQDGPNHWAIGAVVRVQRGGTVMSRLITAGTSFMGQEPAEAHFGLGSAIKADSVSIKWLDGDTTQFQNVPAGHIYTVRKDSIVPRQFDSDEDGLIDEDELNLYGTDPSDPDTDGDSVSDGHEVIFGSDPLNSENTVALNAPSPITSITLFILLATLSVRHKQRRPKLNNPKG